MCENGYAAMFAGDFTAASPLNGHPGSSDAYAQDDALRAANKRNARKTQLFVQVPPLITNLPVIDFTRTEKPAVFFLLLIKIFTTVFSPLI